MGQFHFSMWMNEIPSPHIQNGGKREQKTRVGNKNNADGFGNQFIEISIDAS